jgi:hypothetical protein
MDVYIPYLGDHHAQRLARDVQNAGATLTLHPLAGAVNLVPLTPSSIRTLPANPDAQQPIIPVLLHPCDVPSAYANGLIDLSGHYAANFPQLISRLASVAAQTGIPPYKGLHPYSELDAPRFSGRHGFLWKLQDHLTGGAPCAVITGDSGSGKTSTTSAGLVATLRESGQAWLPLQITLDDQPLHQMAAHLHPLITLSEDLVSILNSDPHMLSEILEAAAPDGTRLALVLDSFDNVFTRMPLSERTYLLDSLYFAITRISPAYVTILVMREELQARLIETPKWAAALEGNVFPLPPVTRDELIEIIRGTHDASSSGLNITPGFAERIADDAFKLKRPFLPDVSFTLATLVRGGEMSEHAYNALGGVAGAMVNRAEAVIAPLSQPQQLAARRILCQLLDYTEDGEPVARGMARDRFRFAWVSDEAAQQTIACLLDEGFIAQTLDVETGAPYLHLSHVALATEWPRFAGWLQADSESLRYGSQLERLAAVWAGREYAEQALLRGAKLDEALRWIQNPDYVPSSLLENFIEVSKQLRQPAERGVQQEFLTATAEIARLNLPLEPAAPPAPMPTVQVVQAVPRWMIALMGVLLAALLLSGLMGIQIASERDALAATLQAVVTPMP